MPASYRELVVKGNSNLLRGFLWGFRIGKDIRRGLLFCSDHPIDTHHLKEILRLHSDYVHLITSVRHHKSLTSAIKEAEPLEFELVSDKLIRRARFEFKFKTFNRDVASGLKRILKRLPADITLTGYKPKEVLDPSAKGIEMYSPVHHYIFEGKGKVQGDVEKLLAFHTKLRDHEFVEVEEIHID